MADALPPRGRQPDPRIDVSELYQRAHPAYGPNIGTERAMSRVGLVAATAAVMGVALAGCSGGLPSMPDWMTPSMPEWMSSTPAAPPVQPLRFDSNPTGADVHTAQGQTCFTPCVLNVPSENQSVTFMKIGFVPQTVQVSVGAPPDHSFWESTPPPTLIPNPVQVVLQAMPPPPKPVHKPKPRKSVDRTRTAAKTAPTQSGSANPFPDPPPMQPASSPFPTPPPTR